MYEKFEQLDKDKKDRIINAGFKEFGLNGYDKGSTNKIVKEAGISKGLIFHYFGAKENFYFYLIDYSIDFLLEELANNVDESLDDIFEIIEEYMVHKIKIFEKYPSVFDFMTSYMSELNPDISEKVWERLNSLEKFRFDIFESVDEDLFRDDVDPKMAIFTIMSTLEKISMGGFQGKEYMMDETVEQVRNYIRFFRTAFYK